MSATALSVQPVAITAPAAPVHGSLVGAALAMLAGVCDRAHSHDGAGFSGADADFGHSLASKFMQYGAWASARQFEFAQRLCHKYRRQLGAAGFDVAAVAGEVFAPRTPVAPAAPAPGASPGRNAMVVRAVTILQTSASGAAYRILGAGERRTEWLPVSQTTVLEQRTVRQRGGGNVMVSNVQIPAWLAEAKGITAPAITDFDHIPRGV